MTYRPYDSAQTYRSLPEGAYVRGMFLDNVPIALAERIVAQQATAKEVADFAGKSGSVGNFWGREPELAGSGYEWTVEAAIGHCHEPRANLLLGAWEDNPADRKEPLSAGYGICVVLVAKPRGDFPDITPGNIWYGRRPQGMALDVIEVFINYGAGHDYDGWMVMPRQSGITVTSNFDDADRAGVYAAENTLSDFDRSDTISDAAAAALASKHLGQKVEVIRHQGIVNSLYAMWMPHKGQRVPVLAAPPNYTLSTFEVCHEAAHLINDKDGTEKGHGAGFRKVYLSLLPPFIRDHLAKEFQKRGLSVTSIKYDPYGEEGILYHVTRATYLESIKKDGLKPSTKFDVVFLSNSAGEARYYADPHGEIDDNVLLKVNVKGLVLGGRGGGVWEYEGIIPPERITFPEIPDWMRQFMGSQRGLSVTGASKTARVSGVVRLYHGTTVVNWARLNGGDPKAESMQALCARIESDFGLPSGRIWNSGWITWPRDRVKAGTTSDFYCTLDKEVAKGYAVAGTAPLYDFLTIAFTASKEGVRFKGGFFGPQYGYRDQDGKLVKDNSFFDKWMKKNVLKYGGGAIVLTFEVPTKEFIQMFAEAFQWAKSEARSNQYDIASGAIKRDSPYVTDEEIIQWAAMRARDGDINDAEISIADYEVKNLRKYLSRLDPISQPDHITTRSIKVTGGAKGDLPEGLMLSLVKPEGRGLQPNTLVAYVGKSLTRVGELIWWPGGQIYRVLVEEPYRRRGVGSALLARAREIDPAVHHSERLSEDAKAWIKTVGSRFAADKRLTLYRGEGNHDKPSPYYNVGPDKNHAGGWWTTNLNSARQYAAGMPDGKVYVIEVDESEAEQQGLPAYHFIADPKVRSRRRLYLGATKTATPTPGFEKFRFAKGPMNLLPSQPQYQVQARIFDPEFGREIAAGFIRWLTKDITRGKSKGAKAGEIVFVFVHPEYQRQGLATELLRKARLIDPRVHHSDVKTDDGKAWADKVATGGMWWRIHPDKRTFGPDDATSTTFSPVDGKQDPRAGYSCFANPWHLYLYSWLMLPGKHDAVVCFSGSKIGIGNDDEPLVMPDMKTVRAMTWDQFMTNLAHEQFPSSPKFASWMPSEYNTWQRLADHFKYLDQGNPVHDLIVGKYATAGKTAGERTERGAFGVDNEGHPVELDPMDGWQHLDGSVSHEDGTTVTDHPVKTAAVNPWSRIDFQTLESFDGPLYRGVVVTISEDDYAYAFDTSVQASTRSLRVLGLVEIKNRGLGRHWATTAEMGRHFAQMAGRNTSGRAVCVLLKVAPVGPEAIEHDPQTLYEHGVQGLAAEKEITLKRGSTLSLTGLDWWSSTDMSTKGSFHAPSGGLVKVASGGWTLYQVPPEKLEPFNDDVLADRPEGFADALHAAMVESGWVGGPVKPMGSDVTAITGIWDGKHRLREAVHLHLPTVPVLLTRVMAVSLGLESAGYKVGFNRGRGGGAGSGLRHACAQDSNKSLCGKSVDSSTHDFLLGSNGNCKQCDRIAASKTVALRVEANPDVVDYKRGRPLTGNHAVAITTLMPNATYVDFHDAPFADALDVAMGTNRRDDALEVYLVQRVTWWKDKPETTVSMESAFVVTQTNVNTARVDQIVHDPATGGKEPIWMIHSGGKFYVLNGHHRLVADYLRGEADIAARVVEMSALPRTAAIKTKVWRGIGLYIRADQARKFFASTTTSGDWLLTSLLAREFDADFTGRKPNVEGDGIGVWWTTDRKVGLEYGGMGSERNPNSFGGPDFRLWLLLEGEVNLSDIDPQKPVHDFGYSNESPVILSSGAPVTITGIEVTWPVKPTLRNSYEAYHEQRTLPVHRQVTAAKTAEFVDPEWAIPEPQYGWNVVRGVQGLWGKNSWRAMFGDSPTTTAPWGFHRFGPRSPLNKEAVHEVLRNPGGHRAKFDPRTLWATQPGLTRSGVSYYLHDPTYALTGRTFADQNKEENRIPVVYVLPDGRSIILSGHHRAAAALLKGEPLTALRVEEPASGKAHGSLHHHSPCLALEPPQKIGSASGWSASRAVALSGQKALTKTAMDVSVSTAKLSVLTDSRGNYPMALSLLDLRFSTTATTPPVVRQKDLTTSFLELTPTTQRTESSRGEEELTGTRAGLIVPLSTSTPQRTHESSVDEGTVERVCEHPGLDTKQGLLQKEGGGSDETHIVVYHPDSLAGNSNRIRPDDLRRLAAGGQSYPLRRGGGAATGSLRGGGQDLDRTRSCRPGAPRQDSLRQDRQHAARRVTALPDGLTFLNPREGNVQAWLDGRFVAGITWLTKDQIRPTFPEHNRYAGEIEEVFVDEDYRRQGIATELLRRAREIEPRVHHSTFQTFDGEAWADKVAGRNGDLPAGMTITVHPSDFVVTMVASVDSTEVGYLVFLRGSAKIASILVEEPYRRMGVASELLRRAREVDPRVHHSDVLLNDGAAWSQKVALFAMPTTWYHGASQSRAEDAAERGFPVDYTPNGALYGKGLYLTNLYSDAEGFAGRVDGGLPGAVLEIDPMFTNPFISTIDPEWDVSKAYPGEKGKPEEILRRHGHDGIIIAFSSRIWAVVYHPAQVRYVTHDLAKAAKKVKAEGITIEVRPEGDDDYLVVAKDGDRVVGGLLGGKHNAVSRIFVMPIYRRRGIATDMYDALTDKVGTQMRMPDEFTDQGAAWFSSVIEKDYYSTWGSEQDWSGWLKTLGSQHIASGMKFRHASATKDHVDMLDQMTRKHFPPQKGYKYSSFYELIAKEGKVYSRVASPEEFEAAGYDRGAMGGCYQNAANLAFDNSELTYVEGFADMSVIPMPHAWCMDRSGTVFDPTWTKGSDYFGVPVPTTFLRAHVLRSMIWGLFGGEGGNDGANHDLLKTGIPKTGSKTANYTEFVPPEGIVVHSGGDAVPGGFNGYFVAYDKVSGKKMGYLDYQSAPGEPVLIAMVEVDPAFRRRGIATLLLAALRHDFPDGVIVPGYVTEDGQEWWSRAKHTAALGASVQPTPPSPTGVLQVGPAPAHRVPVVVAAAGVTDVAVQDHVDAHASYGTAGAGSVSSISVTAMDYRMDAKSLVEHFEYHPGRLTKFREKYDEGAYCDDVARAVEDKWDFEQVFGLYRVDSGGVNGKEMHSWNTDEYGTIIDFTADQFGDTNDYPRVLSPRDENFDRYTEQDSYQDWAYEDSEHTAGKKGDLPEGLIFTPYRPSSNNDKRRRVQRGLVARLGDRLGGIGWIFWYEKTGEIVEVEVNSQYQRRGLATALLAEARKINPDVHHSKDLTDEGKAWSQTVAGKNGDLPEGMTLRYRDGRVPGGGSVSAWVPRPPGYGYAPRAGESSLDLRIGELSWTPSGAISWVNVYEDEHQRRGVASAMLEFARTHRPDLRHSDELSEDSTPWAAHTGQIEGITYRWARPDLIIAEQNGQQIGEMVIGIKDKKTAYVASVISQQKRQGIAEGLLLEFHRKYSFVKMEHSGFHSRSGLSWGRAMVKKYPEWNVFAPDHLDKEQWHLSSAKDTVPPEPGKTRLPPGCVRLYHVSGAQNLDSIRRGGLRIGDARGETYGEPNLIWGSTNTDYFKDSAGKIMVEFWERWDKIVDRFDTPGSPSSNTTTERHDDRQSVLDGEYDYVLEQNYPDETKAILQIKAEGSLQESLPIKYTEGMKDDKMDTQEFIYTVRKDRVDRSELEEKVKRGPTHIIHSHDQTWCGRKMKGLARFNSKGKIEDVDCSVCQKAFLEKRPKSWKG